MAHRHRLPAHFQPAVRPLLTALAIATGSMSAHALTLGRLQVLSSMGEPLRAEVEITPTSAEESQGLQAKLAAPRSFQQAGMEYNAALEGLSSSIESRGGRSFIVLQGRKPVRDTFIDLILETQWSTGQLVRNYALLLNSASDKPQQAPVPSATTLPAAAPPAAPIQTPPGNPPRVEYNAQNVPVYRFDPVDATKATPVATSSAGNNASALPIPAVKGDAAAQTGVSVTVRPGQTASHLALAHMPAVVSLDQMLVAMLRNNPHAFIEDNVNLVRAGAVLHMPTAEQAQQTSAQQARQIVVAQTRDFVAYARRLAESPLKISTPGSDREATGKVSTDIQTLPEGAAQDTLTLSKSQVGNNSAEVKLAAEREAREASEQMAELNKNIEDLNKLVAVATSASEPAFASTATAGPDGLAGSQKWWLWGAGLAALWGFWLWRRNRQTETAGAFAPSYDDEPTTASATPSPSVAGIPPSMASIDLDLSTNSLTTHPPVQAPRTVQDTDAAKLELAQLLLAKGDKDIARTLVHSVAANGIGEHKAKALQMLGQIQ